MASFSFTSSGGVILRTPYLPAFVYDLKATIPMQDRAWDPDAKVWYVDKLYADIAIQLFYSYFPEGMQKYERNNGDLPDWCYELHVLPSAPRQVIEAAYRVLSKEVHPDAGGNTEKMIKLNSAVEDARKETTQGGVPGSKGGE